MKASTFITIVFALLVAPCGGAETDANDVSAAWRFLCGATAGDQVAEVRVGVEIGNFELYAAPRFDKTLASDGDLATDIRTYLIYNALTTEMVAHWVEGQMALPDGRAYAGVFGGWEFRDGGSEFGWLVGVKVVVKETEVDALYWITEYQRPWQSFRPDEEDLVVTGPLYLFRK